jgi:hypothetical protein
MGAGFGGGVLPHNGPTDLSSENRPRPLTDGNASVTFSLMKSATQKTPRPPSPVMLAILASFNRAPVKARGEIADSAGRVCVVRVEHFDWRSFSALVSRGLIDHLTRCRCGGASCDCNGNGWHITAAGVAALENK